MLDVRPGERWLIREEPRMVLDVGTVAEHQPDFVPDLLLADPPYGQRRFINRRSRRPGASRGSKAGDPLQADLIGDEDGTLAASAMRDLLGAYPTTLQIWWGANLYEVPSVSSSWIVWDKTGGGKVVNDNACAELAWTNRTGPTRIFTHLWKGMCRASEPARTHPRVHPTQKPVALARWCIEDYPKKKIGSIYEPFAGAAPGAVAAMDLGLRYHGVELAPEYAAAALQRLVSKGATPRLIRRTS